MKFDSTMVSSISLALIHFLWQGAIIGVVVYILLKCIRKESCEKRYLVSSIGLILMPVCFIYTLCSMFQEGERPSQFSHDLNNHTSLSLSYFFFCWLAGILFFTLRLIRKMLTSHRLKSQQITLPREEWQIIFSDLIKTLILSKSIRLLESKNVSTPMVVGLLSPVVIVPLGFMCGLTPMEVKAILAHELAHIRRHDHLFNLFQECIEVIFFFHPVTWFISNSVRKEREYCCDRIAVKLTGDPVILAKSLTFMESCRHYNAHGLCANGGSLKSRIYRLLNQSETNKSSRQTNMKKIQKTIVYSTLSLSALIGLIALDRATEEEIEVPRNINLITAKDIPKIPVWDNNELRAANDQSKSIQFETHFMEISTANLSELLPYKKYITSNKENETKMNVLTSIEADAFLEAARTRRGTDIMTAPSVISQAGDTAKLEIVRPLELIENESGIETVNLGVTTQYRPILSDNGQKVNVDCFAQIVQLDSVQLDSVLDKNKAQKSPKFDCTTFVTKTDIPLGSTGIIATKSKEGFQLVSDKVPFFGDIPFIGRLFREASMNKIYTVTLMTVTPKLVSNDAQGTRGHAIRLR